MNALPLVPLQSVGNQEGEDRFHGDVPESGITETRASLA